MPRNQRSSAALYLKIRMTVEKGDYSRSLDYINQFLVSFPESGYAADVKLLRARTYYDRGVLFLALQELLDIIAHKPDDGTREKAVRVVVNLFDPDIPDHIYDGYREVYTDPDIRSLLDLKSAQLAVYQGDYDRSLELMNRIESGGGIPAVLDAVHELRVSVENDFFNTNAIVMLLPFTGAYAEQGLRLYKGAQLALDDYNRSAARPLLLKPLDTGGSAGKIPGLIHAAAEDHSVLGIVGPVDPQLQVLAASMAAVNNIPLILPENCRNNISEDNENVFRLAGSGENEGRALARFAVNELGLSTFAILSPMTGLEEDIANSFAIEVDKLGGQILVHEWFYPGAIDYHKQFRSIRKIGYDLMMADSLRLFIRGYLCDSLAATMDSIAAGVLDSLNTVFIDSLSISQLDSFRVIYQDTLIARMKAKGIREVDSLDIPVSTYDALFIPITDPEELDYIANQFAFFNLRADVIGNSAWYNKVMLNRVKNAFRFSTVYFTSDYFIDEQYEPWTAFRDHFRVVTGFTPGIDEMYGYDAMLFILNGAGDDVLTRRQFQRRLIRQRAIENSGRGAVILDDAGQKSNWLILRYKSGFLTLYRTAADGVKK